MHVVCREPVGGTSLNKLRRPLSLLLSATSHKSSVLELGTLGYALSLTSDSSDSVNKQW